MRENGGWRRDTLLTSLLLKNELEGWKRLNKEEREDEIETLGVKCFPLKELELGMGGWNHSRCARERLKSINQKRQDRIRILLEGERLLKQDVD